MGGHRRRCIKGLTAAPGLCGLVVVVVVVEQSPRRPATADGRMETAVWRTCRSPERRLGANGSWQPLARPWALGRA